MAEGSTQILGIKFSPIGQVAYSPEEIFPDGYIWPTIFVPNEEDPEVPEKIRQLPASSMFFEIQFRTSTSSNTTPLSSGPIPTATGVLAAFATAGVTLGGVANTYSHFVNHICEAETQYNVALTAPAIDPTLGPLTVRFRDTVATDVGRLELPGYPMMIYSVTTEKVVLSEQQLNSIGSRSLRGITGPITPFGGYEGKVGFSEIQIEDGSGTGTTRDTVEADNRFLKIDHDSRRHPFRADNKEGGKYVFANGNERDLIDKSILIDMTGINEGDRIYVTMTIAKKRLHRFAILNKGTNFTGASIIGRSTQSVTFGEGTAFSYSLRNWRVPKVGQITTGGDPILRTSLLPSSADKIYYHDADFSDRIEGWRVSEIYSGRKIAAAKNFWALDHRGILIKVGDSAPVVVHTAYSLGLDTQQWFIDYLAEHDIVGVDQDFSDEIDYTGALFDLSEHVNATLYDEEKIPYHRDFALALDALEGVTIGIPNLDLTENAVPLFSPTQFDLSSAVFETAPVSSIFGSIWQPTPMQGNVNNVVFEPSSAQNGGTTRSFNLIVPPAADDATTDWLLRSPFIDGRFGKETRMYAEYYGTSGIGRNARQFSFLYAWTNASALGTMGIDWDTSREKAYLIFPEENSGIISYHKFDRSRYKIQSGAVEPDPSGNHVRPDFDHDSYKSIGANRMIGDAPSYSRGKFVTTEHGEVCLGQANPIVSDFAPTDSTSSPLTIALDSTRRYKKVVINYWLTATDAQTLKDEEDNGSVSFDFGNGLQINNIFAINTEGRFNLEVDTGMYRGDKIKVYGRVFELAGVDAYAAVEYMTGEDFNRFKVEAEDVSMAVDPKNKVLAFYGDKSTSNIGVAMSIDEGKNWMRYHGLIRLTEGETASRPYVVSDKSSSVVTLFYILNGLYLMCKKIDTNSFFCDDIDVEYTPISAFGISTNDDEGLSSFSTGGQSIRKASSNFVIADENDQFFQDEKTVATARSAQGLSVRFRAADLGMNHNLESEDFSVSRDGKGGYRVVYVEDNSLSMKCSPDLFSWDQQLRNIVFHKNLLSSTTVDIQSIQMVVDHTTNMLYFMYFHDGMFFFRPIKPTFLSPDSIPTNPNAENPFQNVLTYIDPDQKNSMPLFVAGELDDDLKNEFELEALSPTPLPDLLVKNPFGVDDDVLDQFSSDGFGVDDSLRPEGFFFSSGHFKVFYRSSLNNIESFTMDASNRTGFIPRFDFQWKPKP